MDEVEPVTISDVIAGIFIAAMIIVPVIITIIF